MNSNACVHSIVLSVEVWKVGQLPLAGVFFVCDTALLIAVTSIAVKIIWDTANVLSVLLENDSGIIISSYQRQKQERTSASNIRLPTNRSHLGMYSPIIIFRLIEQFRDRSYTPIFAFFFFIHFWKECSEECDSVANQTLARISPTPERQCDRPF